MRPQDAHIILIRFRQKLITTRSTYALPWDGSCDYFVGMKSLIWCERYWSTERQCGVWLWAQYWVLTDTWASSRRCNRGKCTWPLWAIVSSVSKREAILSDKIVKISSRVCKGPQTGANIKEKLNEWQPLSHFEMAVWQTFWDKRQSGKKLSHLTYLYLVILYHGFKFK